MMRFVSVSRLALAACGCLAVGLLLAGCKGFLHNPVVQCPPPPAATAGGIDMQDLMMAAEEAVASLLELGIFDRAPHHPAVLAISRFHNATSQQLDMSLLPGLIRASLLKTGKVVGVDMEPKAGEPTPHVDAIARPELTLSGSVVDTIERRGSIKQSTYVFQFALAESNGLAVWSENKAITKTTRRNAAL